MDQETLDTAQALKKDETEAQLTQAKARVKLISWGYRLTNLARWLVVFSVGGFVATLVRGGAGIAEHFRTVAALYAVLSVVVGVAFLVIWPKRVRAVLALVEKALQEGRDNRVTDSARDSLYLAWAAFGLGAFRWLVPVMWLLALYALVIGIKSLVSRDGPVLHALSGIAVALVPIALFVAGFVRASPPDGWRLRATYADPVRVPAVQGAVVTRCERGLGTGESRRGVSLGRTRRLLRRTELV